MGFTLAYILNGNLYLNITNRCINNCTFCIRQNEQGVGYDLWLDREPTSREVLDAIKEIEKYDEIIFCGYGEPMLRPDVIIEVAKELKEKRKKKIRINTNGLAERFLGKKILPDLKGLIDTISISLNAQDAETYHKLSRPGIGMEAFNAVLQFAKESKEYIPEVILSVVDLPEVDVEACKEIAERLGVGFRVRGRLTQ